MEDLVIFIYFFEEDLVIFYTAQVQSLNIIRAFFKYIFTKFKFIIVLIKRRNLSQLNI